MPGIIIKIDLHQDAWNWWDACNKVSHGVDWKLKIPTKLRNQLQKKTQEEAYHFLSPFLIFCLLWRACLEGAWEGGTSTSA